MLIIKTVTVTSDKLYPDDVPYFTDNAFAVTVVPSPNSAPVTNVNNHAVTYNDKGLIQRTHQHNFYYRLLVEPSNLALGLLTTATAQTINVWNGYDVAASIVSIEAINLSGFTLTPSLGRPLPLSIPAHVTEKLELISDGSVAAATDGQFKVTFSNGDVVIIYVTATSMVLLDMPPNWKSGYTETYAYKTDVLTSWNGTEQRRALRGKPRYSIEYDGHQWDSDLRVLSNALRNWQNRMFAMPNWLCQGRTKGAILKGGTSVEVNTIDLGFTVGEYAYILADDGSYETLGVDAVTDNGIVFKTQISRDFPANSRIYPVVSGYVESSMTSSFVTESVRKLPIKFRADVLSYSVPMHGAAYPAGESYDGKEIFPFRFEWSAGVGIEWVSNSELIDFVTTYQRVVEKGETLRILSMSVQLHNRSAVNKLKAFLSRCRGRHVSFLMPTDTQDLILAEDYTTNGATIMFKDDGVATHMRNHQPYIRIKLKTKTYYRRMMMVEDAGNGIARATLDAPINDNFRPLDVVKISFMLKARLGSDDTVIRYDTDQVATVGFKLQEVIV